MEGFDFNALLQNHGKQHKSKPVQFTSVANGVKRRLETTIKRRRSSRLTIFDRIRNLPQNSPAPKPNKAEEIKQKAEHRKMQLEKWKEEKEKKKKEAAAQKKKPFIVGVARTPPKLGPPQKVMPSTSGRVTRAQTAKNKSQLDKKANSPVRSKKSFAPEHASFCPPLIKGMEELPILVLPKKKVRVTMVQFKPVITEVETTKKCHAKPNNNLKTNKNKENVHNKISNKPDSVIREVFQVKVNSPRMTRNKTQEKNKMISKSRAITVGSSHSDDSDPERLKTKGKFKETKVQQNRGKMVTKPKSITSSLSDRSIESPEETQATVVNTKTTLQERRSRLNNGPISVNSSSSDDNPDSPASIKSKTRKSTNFVTKPSTKGESSACASGSTVETKKKSIRKSMKTCDISSPLVVIKPLKISCIQIDSTNSESSFGSPVVKKTSRKSLPSPKCTPLKQTSTKSLKKTPSKPIPNSESSSEERLRSPKDFPMTPEQITELANQISPCITLSRGKDNARREMQKKLREGLLDEHFQTLDTVDHFHRQLSLETNRLTEMADHWDKMLEQNTLPEIVQEAILTAVGQARLLMSQKFQQFAGLVGRCEAADPALPLVTPADLQGFWDMVYMQVENLDVRFRKLEEMQARGWTVEEQRVERRRPAPARPRGARPAAPSRIRDMIAAARKAKKDQGAKAPEVEGKTFEAGFFCVQSPVRSPAPPAPARPPSRPPSLPPTPARPPTLLKAVLSSEANKASASKNAASFAMLRASMIGKNMDQDVDCSDNFIQFTPVNLQATPGRSILKSSSIKNKSIKMVLFDSSDTNILDSSLDKDISGVQKLDSADSPDSEKENLPEDLPALPIEKENCLESESELSMEKENKPKKKEITGNAKKLVRQDAVSSPIRTRNRRKTLESADVKVLQESIVNTPLRRSMRRKTLAADA